MQRRVTLDEATAHLPELLREVAAGGSVVVEEEGRPLARMVPAEEASDLAAQAKRVDALLEFLEQQPIRIVGPWKREDLYD